MRTLLAIVAAALLGAAPIAAAAPAPAPELPVAGTVVVVVLISDGLALLPVGQAAVPPIACAP